MSTACSQVVPSVSPDLHDRDFQRNTAERQLNDFLDCLASELFPPGTDPFEVYSPRFGELYQSSMEKGHNLHQHYASLSALSTPCTQPSAQPRTDIEWPSVESTRLHYTQSFPKEPRRWSMEHVQTWIQSAAFEQRLGSIDPSAFAMTGDQLCLLTRADFKARAPLAGDILFQLFASLAKADPMHAARVGGSGRVRVGSKCVHRTWYPKEIAVPASPPTTTMTATAREASDTFSDCSSSTSCCFEDKGRATASPSVSVCSSSGFTSYNSVQPINYTPLTGIAQSLPVCESVYELPANPSSCAPPYSMMNINPFPARTYRSPKVDAPPTHLRTFLKELLGNKMYSYCIEWADESKGIFRILNSEEVARFWGMRKNRPKMNYDKLSRSLRFYYKKGLLKKVPGQRLVYQFTEPEEVEEKDKKADISVEGSSRE